MDIKEKLDTLAEYQFQKDAIMLEKQRLIDSILTPEIKKQITDIEAEFSGKTETIDEKYNDLMAEVKDAVIAAGEGVKATHLHAVYAKGRISWDTKGLDGYAVGHPEILFMRKEGDPSVSIRKV